MYLTSSLRRTIATVGATVAIGSSLAVLTPAPAAQAATCKAYTVLAVRGTAETGTLGTRLPTTINAITARKGSSRVHSQGISYPANFNYLASMSSGRAALKSAITTYLNSCKSTRLFLIGYSQAPTSSATSRSD